MALLVLRFGNRSWFSITFLFKRNPKCDFSANKTLHFVSGIARQNKWDSFFLNVMFVFSSSVSYPHRCSFAGSDGSQGNSDRCGHLDCSHTPHDHKLFYSAHTHLSPLEGQWKETISFNLIYMRKYSSLQQQWKRLISKYFNINIFYKGPDQQCQIF